MKKIFIYVLSIISILFLLSCSQKCPECTDGEQMYFEKFINGVYPDSTYVQEDAILISGTASGDDNGSCINNAIGYTQGADIIYRSVLRFYIYGHLPAGVVLQKTYLTLKVNAIFHQGATLQAHEINERWRAGDSCSTAAIDEACWDNSGWSSAWDGGNYNSEEIGSGVINPGDDTITIELDVATVNNWLTNPDDNYGILIKAETESDVENRIYLYSAEYTTPNHRPLLTIYYSF